MWAFFTSWYGMLAGFLGVGVLGIIAQLLGLTAAFPLIKSILDAVLAVLGWLWVNLLWPGLRGMLDGLPQVITFATIVGGLFLYMKANDDIRYNHKSRELQVCTMELKKTKRTAPKVEQPQLWEFKWPFNH